MAKLYTERAKDRYIARELALLRASHPQAPIVSHMDEVNGSTTEEAVRREIAARASERTTTLSNATATFTPALSLSTAIHATDSVGPGSTDCEPSTPAPQTPPPSNNSSATLSALPSPSNTEVDSAVFSATDSVSLVPTDCGPSMSPSRGSPTTVNALSPLPLSTAASSSLASKPPRSVVRQKHRLHPRTPADGCENCQFLFAELRVTRQLLECKIERNYELKQLHSSTMRTNAMKYKRVPKYSASDAPAYVKLVNDFKGHVEGANPPRKDQENAKQRATHVFHFLHFMANSPNPNGNLLFLQDISRVRGFVANLQQRRFKPTTQRIYLMDVLAFLKYLSNMKPCGVRLGERGIKALTVELRARVRDIGRDVVGHQLLVRHKLVKAIKHAQFIEETPKHIDAALADDPSEDTVQSRALTMMAVSSYADKEKKKERSKRADADYDEVVTESPQEDTREGMQESEKKNHGNKQRMVSSSIHEGSGDWQPPKNGTEEEDSEEEEEDTSVKLRVPQLRKKRPASTPRNRVNGTEEEDSEEEEEEEEGSVKQRVPQPRKKELLPSASPRLMVSSSDDEGSGDCQSPKNETEEEASVKLKVPQLQKKRPAPTPRNSLMIQVYVSPATANILAKHSQNVCVKTKSETEMTSDQTKLCDTTVKIKRQEPSEEKERKTSEEERKKLQEEHQIKEEQHGEEVTKERGRPRRKGSGGEEAVKEEGERPRRRGQHGDKDVKVERGCPRRKGPGGEEAVKEEAGCLRRRGQHGDKEVKVERGRPRRKGPGGEEAVKEEAGCLRRRGQHRDKEVKVERGRPRRKVPGGEEAVKEEGVQRALLSLQGKFDLQ
ncbi:hypothetical protein PAMA_002760 [Pampus argenteus]